jgi:flagellin-like protein
MRGITPIIAIILLLLMAVAAAGAAYLWITLMQSTIAGETQSGLEANIAQMQRQLTIPSVWNQTGNHICLIVKNSGTEAYTAAQLKDITVYIENRAYQWNASDDIVGTGDFAGGDTLATCVCNSTEGGSEPECVGPVTSGYDYAGAKIDVKIEPPVGAGGTYNNFQNLG